MQLLCLIEVDGSLYTIKLFFRAELNHTAEAFLRWVSSIKPVCIEHNDQINECHRVLEVTLLSREQILLLT